MQVVGREVTENRINNVQNIHLPWKQTRKQSEKHGVV